MISFENAKDAKNFIEKGGIEHISFYVSDIDGRLRNVTIPSTNFSEKIIGEGIGFDASNLGFAKVDDSDMLMMPDLKFGFTDPVEPESKVLYFLCDIKEVGGEKSFSQDLRHIVHKTIGSLKEAGVADEVKVGVELEFYVLDELFSIMTNRETSFKVRSCELTSPPSGEESYRIAQNRGYFRSEPNDHLFTIRNEIVSALEKIGLGVKYHHHEVGSSQAEIEFKFLPVEFMADATTLAKSICHRIAKKHGKIISFLPKIIPGEAGNGMHVHQFLLKNNKNVFHDKSGLYKLSKTALSYIAGILDHSNSLPALTNPTTNSYRRLIPGLEAPVKAVFAEGNRSAAIRIPGYIQDDQERRIEFRTIDATCNPYLAYSAMIMAGLDGIRRNLDPTEKGFGPFETNLYKLSEEELSKIKSFPKSFDRALQGLEEDYEYLTYNKVFPKKLLQKWIEVKTRDISDMQKVPHPWEVARYYDL